MNTFVVSSGDWDFKIRGGRIIKIYSFGSVRPERGLSDTLQIIHDTIGGYEPSHGVTGFGLIRMLINGIDRSIIDYLPFAPYIPYNDTQKIWFVKENLKKTYNMSDYVCARFTEYVEQNISGQGGFCDSRDSRFIQKKSKEIINRAMGKCRTHSDILEMTAIFYANNEVMGNISQDTKDIYITMLKEMTDVLTGLFFREMQKREDLDMCEKIILKDHDRTATAYVKNNAIQYIDCLNGSSKGLKEWPSYIKPNVFELVSESNSDYLSTVFQTLEEHDIMFEDVMKQCRDEIKNHADISGFIRDHTSNAEAEDVVSYESMEDYHEMMYPSMSEERFMEIWGEARCDGEWSDDGFEERADLRKFVLKQFNCATQNEYFNFESLNYNIAEELFYHYGERLIRCIKKARRRK